MIQTAVSRRFQIHQHLSMTNKNIPWIFRWVAYVFIDPNSYFKYFFATTSTLDFTVVSLIDTRAAICIMNGLTGPHSFGTTDLKICKHPYFFLNITKYNIIMERTFLCHPIIFDIWIFQTQNWYDRSDSSKRKRPYISIGSII